MDLEFISERFERVKWDGRGFTSLCPAHADQSPSLAVYYGMTGYLVKCQVGCSFFDVVAAVGLNPIDFKYERRESPPSSTHAPSRARAVMKEMRRWKVKPLVNFAEACDVALEPPIRRLVAVTQRYPLIMLQPWRVAQKMWVIAMDGPVFELLHGGEQYRGNWTDEKQIVGRQLWGAAKRCGVQ